MLEWKALGWLRRATLTDNTKGFKGFGGVRSDLTSDGRYRGIAVFELVWGG